jgi:aspartyl-tRNA(Asn)/glutamyl-tRNA(Gln) amidotransferase subunit A
MSDDPALWPASRLRRAFARRELSPVEVTEACLRRIDRLDPRFGAFCLVDRERALTEARASEERWRRGEPLGPLDGVPVTVKDLVDVAGWPTRRGSRTLDDAAPAAVDAPAVARLRRAGVVFLGKTTTPEFGWKAATDNPRGDLARNPWNPERTPGGSSGGAAVAAALGMGCLHIGTDGGGSIRIPAAFTGIFGLKPTFGRVPADPPSPFGTLAHLGPMTRTVEDAAAMLTVMAGHDRRDWYALPDDGRDYAVGLDGGIEGARIGVIRRRGQLAPSPELVAAFDGALATLEELGGHLEDTVLPMDDQLDEMFDVHWSTGAANVIERLPPEKRELVEPGLREIAARGAAVDAARLRATLLARQTYGAALERMFERFDFLVSPAVGIGAFGVRRLVPDGLQLERWLDWTPFSYPFNLGQQPACSVPMGRDADGMPLGLQIVAPKYADSDVLRAARAFESRISIGLPPAAVEGDG